MENDDAADAMDGDSQPYLYYLDSEAVGASGEAGDQGAIGRSGPGAAKGQGQQVDLGAERSLFKWEPPSEVPKEAKTAWSKVCRFCRLFPTSILRLTTLMYFAGETTGTC